jgi:spore coat polysaccharide biosynthesis predicted glycosyltransferase SpsG
MENRVAYIRADGSKKIGMGHLKRACIISGALRKKFKLNVKLIMKNETAALKFLQNREIETVLIPEKISPEEELKYFNNFGKDQRPDLFVLDVLEQDTDPSYMETLNHLGCPVMAITDDSRRKAINADLIINGNPNQLNQDYSGESGRYLIGPKYFIMDSTYENIEAKEPEGDVKNILLTVGGSDHNNLLFRILDIIEGMKRELSVMVVVSKASGYVDRLQEYLKRLTIHTQLFVDVKSLVSFWEQCDIAITAAGNTLFERIATRLPGATLCQLDRQMEIADCFESLGVNVNLGFGPDVSDEIMLERIIGFIDDSELQRLQYQRSPDIVDGNSLGKLINEIQCLLRRC